MQRWIKKYSDYVATLSPPGRVFVYIISFFAALYVAAILQAFLSIFSLVFIGWLVWTQWNKHKGSNQGTNLFNGQPPPPPPPPTVNPTGRFPQPPPPGSQSHQAPPQTGTPPPPPPPPTRPTIDWDKP